jgi:hypothetical protein
MGVAGVGLILAVFAPFTLHAQIDPFQRELVQVGYNAALQGHQPLALYAFYYRNDPNFLKANLTLRTAIAPTYLDAELGFEQGLGPNTDFGIGLAGGGFADSYSEIRNGRFLPSESFTGHSAEVSAGIYHCFNPGRLIPLAGVLRGVMHQSFFVEDDDTADDFETPDNFGTAGVRAGLRWGGTEPTLFPKLAMELSAWYEGQFRTESGVYGFGDRSIESQAHLFWGQALLAYTLTNSGHSFYVSLSAGSVLNGDRFSAYRLGALLPLVSEFPLSLPGYFYQEISAENFVLAGANYSVPLDSSQKWFINFNGTTAVVDYLDGLEQEGNWHSGVGAGLLYTSPSWKVMVGYGYGVNALREHGHGAHSIGFLLQLDWERARAAWFKPEPPGRWRGLQRFLGVLGS